MLHKLSAISALLSLAVHGLAIGAKEGRGFITFPVSGRTGSHPLGKHTKRQESVSAVDRHSGTFYTIDITIGTPGQTVPVQFDTGAPDLWINPSCTEASDAEFCSAQSRFTSSSTLVDLKKSTQLNYGAGRANIRYLRDFVTIGSAQIADQVFGVATESSILNLGILGAAPSLSGWEHDYPSVFDNLVAQGLIGSRSFGMNLRGFQTDSGAVIFGGLDTKKFTGPLKKLPVIPAEAAPQATTRWWVSLDGISVDRGDGQSITVFEAPSGNGQVVLVDSGYTMSALPKPIFQKLVAAFPEAEVTPDGFHSVDCLDEGEGGFVSFTFGDLTINVPYHDFVWHVPGNDDLCFIGAYEDEFPVLGDTFLRAAYVVYDFDHRTVHMAQSDDCGSNIVAITDGVSVTEGDCGKPSAA
ncbi:uncharacterized protein DNG_07928 [Cephalotrichum gorgonifer]|uniref:Peptidase A1 domain-containing protein n=1 Tax=Cephalotrichum gorgonifer TaxID=2041049 RepID=A0AAE8N2J4_9PEZI|nr:uncharacterized protein DNG_07928 [Cephalotrichum gorgonifer]